MGEQPGYFAGPHGTPLFGAYHAPERAEGVPVLMAPALFEERKSAYAALAGLARKLASQGHPVLRFDYRGSGESGGASAGRRWRDLAADLAAAKEHLARWTGARAVALAGLRLGATLALSEAARLEAATVVALAPVAKGAAEVRLWRLRSKARAELTGNTQPAFGATVPPASNVLDLDGFEVAPEFLEDVAGLDLLAAPPRLTCPALILQVSHRQTPSPDYQRLAKTLGPLARLECLRLEPFWNRLDDVDTGALEERIGWFLGTARASSERVSG
jgi:alpha/beta superfamily hydrolase